MLSKLNLNLKSTLPLVITNESCVLITEENHSSYTTCTNVGKYFYRYPFVFTEGKTYPKIIAIHNIAIFDENGTEQMGCSVHAGFNTETAELDQCIGFITYIHKTTRWLITKSSASTMIWFKNIKGEMFQPYRFIIVGRYIY